MHIDAGDMKLWLTESRSFFWDFVLYLAYCWHDIETESGRRRNFPDLQPDIYHYESILDEVAVTARQFEPDRQAQVCKKVSRGSVSGVGAAGPLDQLPRTRDSSTSALSALRQRVNEHGCSLENYSMRCLFCHYMINGQLSISGQCASCCPWISSKLVNRLQKFRGIEFISSESTM